MGLCEAQGCHFNEVVLDEVFVPDGQVVGTIGNGWAQVTSELAYERSGPERLLSTFVLLETLAGDLASRAADGRASDGRASDGQHSDGQHSDGQLEGEIIDVARTLTAAEPDPDGGGIARDS